MFADNTVFIVGAGASAEFGLPVGAALMDRIKTNAMLCVTGEFDKEPNLEFVWQTLEKRHTQPQDVSQRIDAMKEISRSIDLAGSIDEFINRHQGDALIAEAGKLHIAFSIAAAEKNSNLVHKPLLYGGIDWDGTGTTWIRTFAELLFQGVRNDQVETIGNNITIISFNYDRSIEHYLTEAITKTFRGVDRKTAREIVEGINIIHPYGTLGSIKHFPFGKQVTAESLDAMSASILTWSETAEGETRTHIQDAMSRASSIVFLGFAFAPQNMEMLTCEFPLQPRIDTIQIYATGFGYDPVIDDRLRQKIVNLYPIFPDVLRPDEIHIQYKMKCCEFIRSHSMALVQ